MLQPSAASLRSAATNGKKGYPYHFGKPQQWEARIPMKDNLIVAENSSQVIGVLSGWDRVVFRGCCPLFAFLDGMLKWLLHMGIWLTDYSKWALAMSDAMKRACLQEAEHRQRPIRYLRSSGVRKDELARQILQEDPVSEGLVCVLTCLEPCQTYRVRGNRRTKQLELRQERTKCLHVYKYWLDAEFGLMGARLQTWLPYGVQVWINGREWLARKLDRKGIAYRRNDNCFPWIEDFDAAQKLMNQTHRKNWIRVLDRILARLCPGYRSRLDGCDVYWTAFQTEWATDICFGSTAALRAIYRPLIRGAMTALGCENILRFMNKRRSFQGDVDSNFRKYPEGVRVKHHLGGNTVKAYDKGGSVLRIETTINQPKQFRVFRAKQGDPEGEKAWRPLRKSVADLRRRAEVCGQVNDRYAEALGSLDTTTQLGELLAPICRPIRRQARRYRALRPWSEEDRMLLATVARGEYVTEGFTNRDLAAYLYPRRNADRAERSRIASRTSYRLRLLRNHGLIRKVKSQRRYHVTPKGRKIISAILTAQAATLQQLNALAA
jgi:hypothetical protein